MAKVYKAMVKSNKTYKISRGCGRGKFLYVGAITNINARVSHKWKLLHV